MLLSTLVRRLAVVLALFAASCGVELALRNPPPAPGDAGAIISANVTMSGSALAPKVGPAVSDGNALAVWALDGRGELPMPPNTPAAHASNLLVMPPDHPAALTAFWFAGDRESAPNVQIAASQWSRAAQQWSPAQFVVNRHILGQQLGYGVRRLGNPVAWIDARGRMHLFVVATGLGGWAASRVVHLQQNNASWQAGTLEFEPARGLPLAWLWNTSFLVRNAPLGLADGGMALPVHFELGLKHAALLQFSPEGDYLGMVKISSRHDLLQPAVVMQTPTDWLAFMRVQRPDGRIAVARSSDAGAHWHDAPDLALRNPDAAVAALAVAPGHMVLAYNPSSTGRTFLLLGQSSKGSDWSVARAIAQGVGDDEFSYPAIAWDQNRLWVSYTVDRKRIAWQRFRMVPANALPTEVRP